MRVLHLTADWKWTGPAEPMLHAVAGLRARGHAVDLACPGAPPGASDGLLVRARERGLEPVLVLERARSLRLWRDREEVARLRALLARERYDVVHAHHTRDHLLAALAARGTAVRVLASWHAGEPITPRVWNRIRFGRRWTSGLCVLSSAVAHAAARELRLAPERLAVVPGAVDAERFAPRLRRREVASALGLEAGERVLGLVARLQPHRRVELVLEALRAALSQAPGLRLVVIGRGTRAREILEEPVKRLGLARAVVRAGYRREDYQDVLAWLDALVYLVPGSDGSCRAVLEAMAMEIPTVASRRGVLPETVLDSLTGRLVDLDRDALAGAFVDVWKDPEAWRERGRAARRRVLEHHTVELLAERLERFYAGLLGSAS